MNELDVPVLPIITDKIAPADVPAKFNPAKGGIPSDPQIAQDHAVEMARAKLQYMTNPAYEAKRKAQIGQGLSGDEAKAQAIQAGDTGVAEAEAAKSKADRQETEAIRTDDIAYSLRDKVSGIVEDIRHKPRSMRTEEQRWEDINNARQNHAKAVADLEQAQKTVAEIQKQMGANKDQAYSPEYFRSQLDVLRNQIDYAKEFLEADRNPESGGGPLTATESMVRAFQEQDYLKMMVEAGIPPSREGMIPTSLFQEIRRKINQEARKIRETPYGSLQHEPEDRLDLTNSYSASRRRYTYRTRSETVSLGDKLGFSNRREESRELTRINARDEARANLTPLFLGSLYENGTKYAQENSLITTEAEKTQLLKTMDTFAVAGSEMYTDIRKGPKADRLKKFIADKYNQPGKEVKVDHPENAYFVGCAELNELFTKYDIPPGKARVPYILAYSSGMMGSYEVGNLKDSGAPTNEGILLFQWIADSLPTSQRVVVPENSDHNYAWQLDSTDSSPRGLGWSHDYNTEMSDNRWYSSYGSDPDESKRHNAMIDGRDYDSLDARIEADKVLKSINELNEQRGLVGEEGWNSDSPIKLPTEKFKLRSSNRSYYFERNLDDLKKKGMVKQ